MKQKIIQKPFVDALLVVLQSLDSLQSPDGNLEDKSGQTSTYHNMSRVSNDQTAGKNIELYYLLDKRWKLLGLQVILHVCESSCMSVSHLACLRVILYVCESSSISKRQGIYSVIVCRLLSLLLCIALAKCYSWCDNLVTTSN